MSQVSLPLDVSKAMEDASRVFGRYVLLQQLGRGGMGTVYKAWQIPLKRYVAIKILHEGESEDNLARFMREAQTASQLHHSNIAAIYEVGNHAGRFFIAMQFIDGVTMDGLFERKLEREKLLKILRAASLAVHAAHENGVVHRDLKPSNIMLSKEGRPFVLDFGIARQMRGGDTLTEAGMVVGTPTYMAPEQASGNPQMVDRRSDVWSLGVILYEILTGTVPHRGRSAAETLMYLVNQDPPGPSTRAPGVPRDLEAVCLKALERERRRRYATAEDFAADLQRWLDGTAVAAKPLTVVEKLSRKLVRLRRQLVAAAVMLVLAGAAVVGWGVVQGTKLEKLRREAREAMARERWTDALRLWERLGNDAEAKVKAAECQQRLDEMQRMSSLRAGQAEMDRANRKWEQAIDVRRKPGQHEVWRKFLREAEAHVRAALRIHGTEAEWWFRLGEVLYELRDSGCINAFSKAIERKPALTQAYYFRAKMTALNCLDALILDTAPLTALDTWIADVQRDMKEATRSGLDPARRMLLETVLFLQQERFGEAEEALRQATEKAADELEYEQIRALVNVACNRSQQAEAYSSRLVELRPNDPFHRIVSAQAAIARSDFATAKARALGAIDMDPENLFVRHHAAVVLHSISAHQELLAQCEEILKRSPDVAAVHVLRAEALESLQRTNEAAISWRKAISRREDLGDARYVQALTRCGEAILAIEESETVIKRLSETRHFTNLRRSLHSFRGIAYRQLKQHESALREFSEASRLGAPDPVDLLGAAEALLLLKRDRDRAEELLRRARPLCSTEQLQKFADYVADLVEKSRRP